MAGADAHIFGHIPCRNPGYLGIVVTAGNIDGDDLAVGSVQTADGQAVTHPISGIQRLGRCPAIVQGIGPVSCRGIEGKGAVGAVQCCT